ncbi:MAG: GntR family transcriptional regulator [Syntrophomonadaceae bacterium]|nr:GntR family transcriptional regulator [Syntrophomonadaceae bacterium]
MWFIVDPRSSIPIYLQLVNGVKEAVARGVLVAGEKMPSVRELATQITINPNTIAKAYQELEREGIIETFRGRGTFVTQKKKEVNREDGKRILKMLMRNILIEAYHFQFDSEETVGLFQEVVRAWEKEQV